MDEEKVYLCSSATWSYIKRSSSPEEAAAEALQQHMESGPSFSVAPTISVVEIKLVGEAVEVNAPSVLADLGFHKISRDLSNAIKRDK